METAFLINGLLSSIISARALLDGNWHNIDDLVVALHAEKAPLIEAYQFIERRARNHLTAYSQLDEHLDRHIKDSARMRINNGLY